MRWINRSRTKPAISLAAVAIVMAGCGGSGSIDDPIQSYLQGVEPQIQRLANSAEFTQRVLARVSTPGQLPESRALLVRQLDLIDEVRTTVAAHRPEDAAARPGHVRLTNAMTAQRRYMVQLTRGMGQKEGKGLPTLESAGKLGATTKRAWAKVSADGSVAAEAIASSDLADVSGVRTALRTEATQAAATRQAAAQRAAAQAAAAERRRQEVVPSDGGGGYAPATRAEARALTDQAWSLIQSGRYSEAEQLSQRAVTALSGTGDGYEGNAYYNLGLSILRQGRCSDALWALGQSTGATGTAQQQRVRHDTYAEALRCA